MIDKYFVYDCENGFETYPTVNEAREMADQLISDYRENAMEGWSEDVESVCWGKILEQATEKQTGQKIEFDGEMVDCVDYVLAKAGEDE